MALMDRFEAAHYYSLYASATIAANRAREKFENAKDFFERGYTDEKEVHDAEEEYLAAKAEADRLWRLSEYGPEPEENKRWEPKHRMNG